MLKYFIIISLLVTIITVPVRLENVLESFIERRCVANSDIKRFNDFKVSTERLAACVWSIVFDSYENVTEEKAIRIFCIDIRSTLYFCIFAVVEKLELCLDKEEKFVPNVLSEWFNMTFDELCKDGGKSIPDHEHYLGNISRQEALAARDDILKKCSSDIDNDLKTPGFVIKKDSLWRYLEHEKKCFLDLISYTNYLKKISDQPSYDEINM